MSTTKIVVCFVAFAVAAIHGAEEEKRGLLDLASQGVGSGLAQLGQFVLPQSAMDAGCSSVGLKNQNFGGQNMALPYSGVPSLKRGLLDLAGQVFGSGVAQLGSFVLPKSAMEAGCQSVGQYGPQQQQPQYAPVYAPPIYAPAPIYVYDPPNVQYQG